MMKTLHSFYCHHVIKSRPFLVFHVIDKLKQKNLKSKTRTSHVIQFKSKFINRKSSGFRNSYIYMLRSVVLISTKPVFGVLRAKLEMVSAAFFEERDFSQVQILKELHQQVNRAVGMNINEEIYLTGLSARELVISFRHRTLILFKLILLEKRKMGFMSH